MQPLHVLNGHTSPVLCLDSAGGESIFSSSVGGSVRVWDVVGGRVKKVLVGHTGLVGRMKVCFLIFDFCFLFLFSFFVLLSVF